MSVKPRRLILLRSDERIVIHAGLLLVCAMLAAMGMGALALLCFLPAAALFEGLSLLSPGADKKDPAL